jgi:hypothetical protein
MGLFKDNPVTNTVSGVFSTFAFPLIASAVFCLLVGMPFLTFWGIVFATLRKCGMEAWAFVSDPNFMNYVHQFFRKLIFMI